MSCPNLFLVGPGRTGTTSLFRYLSQHPDICGSKKKETSYFIPVMFGNNVTDMQEYTNLFCHCEGSRYIMEATPAYFVGSNAIPKVLNDYCPDAKILVILREPIERLNSLYEHIRNKLHIGKEYSFQEYIDNAMNFDFDNNLTFETMYFLGVNEGVYIEHVRKWIQVFGAERVKIVFYDKLFSDTNDVLGDLSEWLGIPKEPFLKIKMPKDNQAIKYKYKTIQKIAMKLNNIFEPFLNRHTLIRRKLRKLYYLINGKTKSKRVMHSDNRLHKMYMRSNQKLLAELEDLGYRDFPQWLEKARNF